MTKFSFLLELMLFPHLTWTLIFFFNFIFFVFLLFLGPLPQHMEIPRLGVESEL